MTKLPPSENKEGMYNTSTETAVEIKSPKTPVSSLDNWLDWLIPSILSILSLWTRYRELGINNTVVWDEAHFGKFGSHYLKNEFYHDVHPPLGKMLVAFAGLLAGYDGSFDFDSGKVYPDNVNYLGMRKCIVMFGALLVPFAYLTAINFGYSRRAATCVAVMVLFDNALLTISRFILLDPILLCFTALSFFSLSAFYAEQHQPFSTDWWFWLFFTGFSLGLVASVKWVGFFTIALVGLYTIEDLFDRFGDLSISKKLYLGHWISRALCLILVPIVCYLVCFWLHFTILSNSGPGDATMNPLFQAHLKGTDLLDNSAFVAFGSDVTIRNMNYGAGLLHSHIQVYPEGSHQQQVTCYHHKDDNNNWVFHRTREAQAKHSESPTNDPEVQAIRDGDMVRLVHVATKKNLHCHQVKAPITDKHWEVSGYGSETEGDEKDYWIVELIDDYYDNSNLTFIRPLSTQFRLRHKLLGCHLMSHSVTLPAWGFNQLEVACKKKSSLRDPDTLWVVERTRHPFINETLKDLDMRQGFISSLIELNVAMMITNNALVPDENKNDKIASQPYHWPLLLKGVRLNGWGETDIKYFLFGNPFVWWLSIFSILYYGLTIIYYNVRRKRRYNDWVAESWKYYKQIGKFVIGGWALHYLPFFIMGRVTYLHHYFPALYFSIFLPPFLVEVFLQRSGSNFLRGWGGSLVFTIIMGMTFASFWYFRHCTYGIDFPPEKYLDRQWLASWTMATEPANE